MRIDPEHARKIASATHGGDAKFNIDIDFANGVMERLNLWEKGLVPTAIARAVRAHRKTPEQRLILALFAPRERKEGDDG